MMTIAVLLLVSACGQKPGHHSMPLSEAYNLLEQNPLNDFRRDRQCGLVYKITPIGNGIDEVIWQVFSSGRALLWFKAHLTPVSADETKVTIDVEKGPDGKELYSGNYHSPRPVVARPVRPAIEEAIAAVLEKRAFDPNNAPPDRDDDLCEMQEDMLGDGYFLTVDDDLSKRPPRPSQGVRE